MVWALILSSRFQFTLPAWGAMDLYFHVYTNLEISIHAPRMGSDQTLLHGFNFKEFSIHAPCMGSEFRLLHL